MRQDLCKQRASLLGPMQTGQYVARRADALRLFQNQEFERLSTLGQSRMRGVFVLYGSAGASSSHPDFSNLLLPACHSQFCNAARQPEAFIARYGTSFARLNGAAGWSIRADRDEPLLSVYYCVSVRAPAFGTRWTLRSPTSGDKAGKILEQNSV